MAGSPFRIVYVRGDGQKFYYSREVEHSIGSIAGTKPFFSADVREAQKFGSPTQAVGRRDFLRQRYPRELLFIESCSGGDPLYEDRSNEVARTEAPVERQNYQADGILIIPASLGRWAIRFPGSSFESIYAATPDEAYQGYLRAIALRPEMAQHVERFVAPEPTNEELAAQIAQAQRETNQARFGPGRRRPGNER